LGWGIGCGLGREIWTRMGITIWIRIQVRGLVTRWLSAGETRMPLAGRDGKGIRGLRSRWRGCGNG